MLSLLLVLLISTSCSDAQGDMGDVFYADNEEDMYTRAFESLDRNKDGLLDLRELKQFSIEFLEELPDQVLAEYDQSKDGKIRKSEFRRLMYDISFTSSFWRFVSVILGSLGAAAAMVTLLRVARTPANLIMGSGAIVLLILVMDRMVLGAWLPIFATFLLQTPTTIVLVFCIRSHLRTLVRVSKKLMDLCLYSWDKLEKRLKAETSTVDATEREPTPKDGYPVHGTTQNVPATPQKGRNSGGNYGNNRPEGDTDGYMNTSRRFQDIFSEDDMAETEENSSQTPNGTTPVAPRYSMRNDDGNHRFYETDIVGNNNYYAASTISYLNEGTPYARDSFRRNGNEFPNTEDTLRRRSCLKAVPPITPASRQDSHISFKTPMTFAAGRETGLRQSDLNAPTQFQRHNETSKRTPLFSPAAELTGGNKSGPSRRRMPPSNDITF